LGSGDTITAFDGGATVNGGSGSDSLIAATGNNNWNVTAQNAGDLNGQIFFTSIEQLVGGAMSDTFHLADGAGVSSGVDVGGGGDTLDYSAFTTAVSVNLQSGSATKTGGITSIENVVGGSGSDTLTAPNTTNSWALSGADAGSINGVYTYASFENVKGGTLP